MHLFGIKTTHIAEMLNSRLCRNIREVAAVCLIYAENTRFETEKRFGHGSRCIILMEISTPQNTQEAEVT